MSFGASVRLLSRLHGHVKEALEARADAAAMRLLEQCQGVALEMGNQAEAERGRGCIMVAILEDYCELVYEVNEQIWHGERVNPGKVYKYLNKSLELMKEDMDSYKERPAETIKT